MIGRPSILSVSPEDEYRFSTIREIGCLVARLRGESTPVPCEIHHLTIGGRHGQKRRGHRYTIGLNTYSHRGVPFGGLTLTQCRQRFGPSYANEPAEFRELVGDDAFLLEAQDQLIAVYRDLVELRAGGGV